MVHKENETAKTHLNSAFEEADLCIIVHIKDALEAGHNVRVVISNDTDVVVARLYHMLMFLQCNLHEAGVIYTTRYTLYGCLGA